MSTTETSVRRFHKFVLTTRSTSSEVQQLSEMAACEIDRLAKASK